MQPTATQVPAPTVTPVTMGGGVSSQMRAFQNLPPNTRIVRGPNGQLSLQKIQAIELTPEQQAVRITFKLFFIKNQNVFL